MTQAEKGDAENGKEKGGEKEKEQRGVKRPIVPALVPESLQEVRHRGRVSVRALALDPGCWVWKGEAGDRWKASGPHSRGWCKRWCSFPSRSFHTGTPGKEAPRAAGPGGLTRRPMTSSPLLSPISRCASPSFPVHETRTGLYYRSPKLL